MTRIGRSSPRCSARPWWSAASMRELGRAEAQEMVRVLPRGAYAEVPEAGHLLPWEFPEEWRRVVEPFLQSVARA